jgi:hypothetical protein
VRQDDCSQDNTPVINQASKRSGGDPSRYGRFLVLTVVVCLGVRVVLSRAVQEGYEGYFGIPTLIEAMNNDAASVPMFVYFMVGIVLALAVGVPALAVIRWKRKGGKFSMFTDSKYEQLTSDQVGIEDADDAVYTRGPTIGPNSPQNMRIRSPSSRNDHSHSPERSHLSTIRMKVPSSPGRDIDF